MFRRTIGPIVGAASAIRGHGIGEQEETGRQVSMATTLRVSLIGFSAFERSTLEAFFRLAARRSPSYLYEARVEQAQVVLVDADSAEAMRDARAVSERSIYIGAQGRPDQLAQMGRPINMMALLKLLDACVPTAAANVPVPAATPTSTVVAMPVAPVKPTAPAPTGEASGATSELLVSRMDNILVVDDSDIALRFMANCLGRFGFHVHLARSGEEALQRVAEEHFEFVFLDVTMQGIDGYQTCRLIKKRPYQSGRRAPSVVMLTSRGGMVDKMRGTLAGCDAYLTKPLQQESLMKVIGDRIVSDVPEADTAQLSVSAR
jgi:two-component system, cell cycle response regulator